MTFLDMLVAPRGILQRQAEDEAVCSSQRICLPRLLASERPSYPEAFPSMLALAGEGRSGFQVKALRVLLWLPPEPKIRGESDEGIPHSLTANNCPGGF